MRQHLKRAVLNKTFESEEIFHLSTTQYSVFTKQLYFTMTLKNY